MCVASESEREQLLRHIAFRTLPYDEAMRTVATLFSTSLALLMSSGRDEDGAGAGTDYAEQRTRFAWMDTLVRSTRSQRELALEARKHVIADA